MDTVHYVNVVGKLVNDSTKYTNDIDEVSVTNIVLINHLQSLLDSGIEIEEESRKKISAYILCMKKELNFYASKYVEEAYILMEDSGYVLDECNKYIKLEQ